MEYILAKSIFIIVTILLAYLSFSALKKKYPSSSNDFNGYISKINAVNIDGRDLFPVEVGIKNSTVMFRQSFPKLRIDTPINGLSIEYKKSLLFKYCYLTTTSGNTCVRLSSRLARKLNEQSNGGLSASRV